MTLPDVAIQFPLRHPAVISTVVGARDGRQSEGGLQRIAAVIPDDLWDELEASGLSPAAA